MIQVFSFVPDHIMGLTLPPGFDFVQEQMSDPALRYAGWQPGLGETLFRDGKPVVCYSCEEQRPGVAFLWVIVSADLGPKDFQKAFFSHWLRWLARASEVYARLEAITPVGYEEAERLIRTSGFEREGVARKWDGERDFTMWARVQ